eukprot:gene11303-2597_t
MAAETQLGDAAGPAASELPAAVAPPDMATLYELPGFKGRSQQFP